METIWPNNGHPALSLTGISFLIYFSVTNLNAQPAFNSNQIRADTTDETHTMEKMTQPTSFSVSTATERQLRDRENALIEREKALLEKDKDPV